MTKELSRRLEFLFWGAVWRLDPRLRMCRKCRLTWELPSAMRSMGGQCHDCWGR